MKLQIDTTAKTIRINEPTNMGELIERLSLLFPNDSWKEYNLEVSIIRDWVNPIIIDRWPTYPYHYPNWLEPIITCETTGTVNLQII